MHKFFSFWFFIFTCLITVEGALSRAAQLRGHSAAPGNWTGKGCWGQLSRLPWLEPGAKQMPGPWEEAEGGTAAFPEVCPGNLLASHPS